MTEAYNAIYKSNKKDELVHFKKKGFDFGSSLTDEFGWRVIKKDRDRCVDIARKLGFHRGITYQVTIMMGVLFFP